MVENQWNGCNIAKPHLRSTPVQLWKHTSSQSSDGISDLVGEVFQLGSLMRRGTQISINKIIIVIIIIIIITQRMHVGALLVTHAPR